MLILLLLLLIGTLTGLVLFIVYNFGSYAFVYEYREDEKTSFLGIVKVKTSGDDVYRFSLNKFTEDMDTEIYKVTYSHGFTRKHD